MYLWRAKSGCIMQMRVPKSALNWCCPYCILYSCHGLTYCLRLFIESLLLHNTLTHEIVTHSVYWTSVTNLLSTTVMQCSATETGYLQKERLSSSLSAVTCLLLIKALVYTIHGKQQNWNLQHIWSSRAIPDIYCSCMVSVISKKCFIKDNASMNVSRYRYI